MSSQPNQPRHTELATPFPYFADIEANPDHDPPAYEEKKVVLSRYSMSRFAWWVVLGFLCGAVIGTLVAVILQYA